jgi:hypothetical protein
VRVCVCVCGYVWLISLRFTPTVSTLGALGRRAFSRVQAKPHPASFPSQHAQLRMGKSGTEYISSSADTINIPLKCSLQPRTPLAHAEAPLQLSSARGDGGPVEVSSMPFYGTIRPGRTCDSAFGAPIGHPPAARLSIRYVALDPSILPPSLSTLSNTLFRAAHENLDSGCLKPMRHPYASAKNQIVQSVNLTFQKSFASGRSETPD